MTCKKRTLPQIAKLLTTNSNQPMKFSSIKTILFLDRKMQHLDKSLVRLSNPTNLNRPFLRPKNEKTISAPNQSNQI